MKVEKVSRGLQISAKRHLEVFVVVGEGSIGGLDE